jgi:hypothetical protein
VKIHDSRSAGEREIRPLPELNESDTIVTVTAIRSGFDFLREVANETTGFGVMLIDTRISGVLP